MDNPYLDPNYAKAIAIDSGIEIPAQITTKVCCDCGLLKSESEFSLKRGKHSPERKPYCVKCERKRAKDAKAKDFDDISSMIGLPCSICGQPSSKIDYSTTSRPLGVLCKECEKLTKRITIDPELIIKLNNYYSLKTKFPGIATGALYVMIGQEQNDTPLFG